MKKLRVFFACVTSRLARLALRLFGRGGTALPGKAALRVYPGLMRELGRGVETVIITGTNGKTTTAGMLRHMLDKAGTAYFSNRSGANLTSGITAEFIENADLLGKPKKTLAVIECDEGNFPAVAAALQPRAVIVTNLFRDQLDRYGEVTHTRDLIVSGIQKAPGAVLCLNADCSLTASLGWDVPNKTVYFGLENISSDAVPSVSDAPHCLRCGARYAYRRYTFAHLGDERQALYGRVSCLSFRCRRDPPQLTSPFRHPESLVPTSLPTRRQGTREASRGNPLPPRAVRAPSP